MNQVLERIGIYDVVAVLFSGMIITLFSDFIDVVFLIQNINCVII